MNELSLFTGAGGGLLASLLLGHRPIGYVENNDYCQQVLAARIRDGLLPVAPIFGDIRAFLSDGYAKRYRGVAELVTAGFPCQPWSTAGKRQGAEDNRNLWPETAETLRVVRPRWALLENVPGLLGSHGYFGQVLGDLAALGFDAWWGVFSACSIGASHTRERLFIVAHANESHGKKRMGDGKLYSQNDRTSAILRKQQTIHAARYFSVRLETESNGDGTLDDVAHRVDRLSALGNGQVPAVAVLAWETLTEMMNQ